MASAWEALSGKVAAAIGEPLPQSSDLSDGDWRRVLGKLGDTNPALQSEVIDAATNSDLRLPAEDEAASDHTRQQVRQSLVGRFLRPDGLRTGAKRFNLRKAINYAGVAFAIGFLIWTLLPKGTPAAVPANSAAPTAVTSTPAPAAPTPATGLVPPAAPPAPPANPNTTSAGVLGLPIPSASVPPAETAGVPIPPIPDGSAPPPPAPTSSSGGIVLYEASRQNKPMIVYQAERPEGGQRSKDVVVYGGSSSPVPSPETAQVPAGGSSTIVYQQSPASAAAQPPSGPAAEPAVSLPRRGTVMTLRLVNPVAVASGWPAAPVLAEVVKGGPEGAVLFGQATLASTGVIAVAFSTVYTTDGKEIPLTAAAYDPAVGRLGVGGSVSTMMPGTAAAAQQAGLSAIAEYAQAMANQQKVTITNGFVTITQGTPNFWWSLGSAIAKVFAPQQSQTTGPTVVTRLDKGAVIAAMVL